MILLVPVLIALGCVAGLPWTVLATSVLLWMTPPVGLVAIACIVIWHRFADHHARRPSKGAESRFLRSLAATVSAGATIREAVATSPSPLVGDHERRLCRLGSPMREVGRSMRASLPTTGAAFGVLGEVSDATGGSIAPAIVLLANRADFDEQFVRDGEVAAAQAKFSAIVVGIVPPAIAGVMLWVRGLPEPGGALVLLPILVGATLMVSGAAMVFLMARRSVT